MESEVPAGQIQPTGTQNPARWIAEDGQIYYRASSLGMCDRMFLAMSMWYTPVAHPDWFQAVLDEGTRMESEIIAKYTEKYELEVSYPQFETDLEILTGIHIVGHVDGFVYPPPDAAGVLFEAKKFRSSTWRKFLRMGVECMPQYPWQVAAYMHALELEECQFVGGHLLVPDEGEPYISEVEVKYLSSPPIPLLGLKKRIMSLEAMINDSGSPYDRPCNVSMFPCPFYYLHDATDKNEPPKRIPDTLVEQALAELAGLEPVVKTGKAAEARAKVLRDSLTGWLMANGVEDDAPVRVSLSTGRTVEMKWHTVHRDGYEVKATDYTQATVSEVDAEGNRIKAKRTNKKAGEK